MSRMIPFDKYLEVNLKQVREWLENPTTQTMIAYGRYRAQAHRLHPNETTGDKGLELISFKAGQTDILNWYEFMLDEQESVQDQQSLERYKEYLITQENFSEADAQNAIKKMTEEE